MAITMFLLKLGLWLSVCVSVVVPLRILLIGDSTDRYIVRDWCEGWKGNHCRSVDQMGGTWTPTSCTTKAIAPASLHSLFNFSKRFNSWSVSVCDSELHNVTLGFLFNMQGVSPYPPWFDEAKSSLGLTGYPPDGQHVTIRETFRHAQLPAIAPLQYAMGGVPDAITINSALWDIARLVTGRIGRTGGIDLCNTTTTRAEWVASWAQNVSMLLDTIGEIVPQTTWLGWRSANPTPALAPSCRVDMVVDMNRAAKKVCAGKQGVHFVDYYHTPHIVENMRDNVHPNAKVNGVYMNDLIAMIKSSIY